MGLPFAWHHCRARAFWTDYEKAEAKQRRIGIRTWSSFPPPSSPLPFSYLPSPFPCSPTFSPSLNQSPFPLFYALRPHLPLFSLSFPILPSSLIHSPILPLLPPSSLPFPPTPFISWTEMPLITHRGENMPIMSLCIYLISTQQCAHVLAATRGEKHVLML